jgi:hypothetical protein
MYKDWILPTSGARTQVTEQINETFGKTFQPTEGGKNDALPRRVAVNAAI